MNEIEKEIQEDQFEKVELMAKLKLSSWLPEGFDGFEPIYNEKDGTITWKKTKDYPTCETE